MAEPETGPVYGVFPSKPGQFVKTVQRGQVERRTLAPPRRRVDNAMVKAIARAFRWRQMLETGVFATVGKIAAVEKINASYIGRVLRLTLLAPEIVEAVLDGRQPAEMTLAVLMEPFPVGWREQTRLRCG